MTPENISRRNLLLSYLQKGQPISEGARKWLQSHPFYSVRYGCPYITADMIALEPGKETLLTVQCFRTDPAQPIVPTFTIPFEKDGFVKVAAVTGSQSDFSKMRKSTKLSLRMAEGITATLRCQSAAGLLMISYQGWVPDLKPMPLWNESIQNPVFAMKKTVLSENMVQYECCGADADPEEEDQQALFSKFGFLVNWYSI